MEREEGNLSKSSSYNILIVIIIKLTKLLDIVFTSCRTSKLKTAKLKVPCNYCLGVSTFDISFHQMQDVFIKAGL